MRLLAALLLALSLTGHAHGQAIGQSQSVFPQVVANANVTGSAASITITDGGTTIFTTEATFVTTTLKSLTWIPALTGALNSAIVITLSTCGVGNAGTLNTEVDRY